ncbi:MAG: hypothetical protein KF746_14370 [Chitinophagaceae bacterium]|nr:hypothetical protein [Chitinophagaceae bacterium]
MRVKKTSGEILFREAQYFRQTWLWVLLISSGLVPLLLVIVLSMDTKSQETPAPVWIVPLVAGIQLINAGCFYFTKLETIITTAGIYYRWAPWFGKYRFLDKTSIRNVQVLKYPYFKYGYHRRKGFGNVHNTNGDKGFRVTLRNGKMFFLGSQKINTVTNVLDKNYADVYQYSSN